jgi:lipopolysaccharide transport system ATP-binding protein
VLAVGDVGFQRKCLGKMDEAARRGRTVLLVSHSMTAVTSICTKGALINAGHLQAVGDVNHVVNEYLRTINVSVARGQRSWDSLASLPLGVFRLATCTPDGRATPVHRRSDPILIQIDGVVREPSEMYVVAVDVKTTNDTLLFRTHNIESHEPAVHLTGPGQFSLVCQVPSDLFPAGTYRLGLITAVAGRHELQNEYPALEFDVVQDELLGDLFVGTRGVLTPPCTWNRA